MNVVELYEFSFYTTVWRYTSGDANRIVGGHLYEVLPGLSRGDVKRSGDASKTEHKVTCPAGVGPALLFATGTPDGVLRLQIIRIDGDGTSVVWKGRVVGCEFGGSVATLSCEPVFTTVKTPGLSRMFTPSCPHDFCDAHCQPPDNNGNYSESNRAYANYASAVFDPGMYFYSGTASVTHPPENIWDESPSTYGEVIEPYTGMWEVRYKDQFYDQVIEGCTHTFEIYEVLERDVDTLELTYSYESYEYWECPDFVMIYTAITGTEDSLGVAHYTQTDPEADTWDDPDGLPTLDDYTSADYYSGVYHVGNTFSEAQDIAKISFLYRDEGQGPEMFFLRYSDDGETWYTASLEEELTDTVQNEWKEMIVAPETGSHLHWAVCANSTFILHGLLFLTRQEYEDNKTQIISNGSVTWAGTPTSGHPVSSMFDGDSTTYGELTGSGSRVIFDLSSQVNISGVSFLNAPEYGWAFDGRGVLYLEYSDNGTEWNLTNCPGKDRGPHNGDDPIRLFFPCNDFGAHRWWSVVSDNSLIRLSELILYKRGRLVRPDEYRVRSIWTDNTTWEVEGSILSIDGATITVSGVDSKPSGFFDGGLLLFASGARGIVSHSGTTLVLTRAMAGLSVGTLVTVRSGCDKLKETCNSRGNIANHGGWPFVPWKNPMSGNTIY